MIFTRYFALKFTQWSIGYSQTSSYHNKRCESMSTSKLGFISYVKNIAKVQKNNMLEKLADRMKEFKTVEEFGQLNKKSTKIKELKLFEQKEKIVEEYIQIFKKTKEQ